MQRTLFFCTALLNRQSARAASLSSASWENRVADAPSPQTGSGWRTSSAVYGPRPDAGKIRKTTNWSRKTDERLARSVRHASRRSLSSSFSCCFLFLNSSFGGVLIPGESLLRAPLTEPLLRRLQLLLFFPRFSFCYRLPLLPRRLLALLPSATAAEGGNRRPLTTNKATHKRIRS